VLQNRAHYVLGDFLNGKETHSLDVVQALLSSEGIPIESVDPVDVITTYYTHADEVSPDTQSIVTVSTEPFRRKNYDGNELEREVQTLIDSVRQLDDYLTGAYLHGSFGDREYVTNYSDVDLLLVVSEETLVDSTDLLELRREIQSLVRHYYYIDPHQHHETMVVAEPELRSYNRAYLSPAALSHGKSIFP
jgi:predicted nucleotidyltransferase